MVFFPKNILYYKFSFNKILRIDCILLTGVIEMAEEEKEKKTIFGFKKTRQKEEESSDDDDY